jgi:hypothetical protein
VDDTELDVLLKNERYPRAEEYDTLPPPHLAPYWQWDFCAWHSAAWWRRHWEKTGLVTAELSPTATPRC